jgi:DNA modification methylase
MTEPRTGPGALDTELVPIGRLTEHPENYNQGDDEKMAELLSRFGQWRPAVVQQSTGRVLIGNTMLRAARDRLGWNHLNVHWRDADDDEARRILVSDNHSRDLADTDERALLALLESFDGDLSGTAYADDDLADLRHLIAADDQAVLDSLHPRGSDQPPAAEDSDDTDAALDDAVPPLPAEPITRPGDMWHLGPHRLLCGDATSRHDVSRLLAEEACDAIVTDPPYNLSFMGKAWDKHDTPLAFQQWCETWTAEALRVLRPGGHLLAFGGTRTWHRLAVAVEDAGFEMRDSIAWLYGSGFPKSLDVSKAVDKLDAAEERRARALEFTAFIRESGLTAQRIDALTGTNMGGHYTTAASQPAVATADLFDKLRPYLPEVPERIEELVRQRTVESQNYAARPVTGIHEQPAAGQVWRDNNGFSADLTAGKERRDIAHTTEAARFQGWGTALKPAFEPIVVARKPLVGTVAANVLAHGTGALNIDGTRVSPGTPVGGGGNGTANVGGIMGPKTGERPRVEPHTAGRWPTNVVLDDHAAAELDEQSGTTRSSSRVGRRTGKEAGTLGAFAGQSEVAMGHDDDGGASRFFPTFRYQAKAPTLERPVVTDDAGNKTAHPTVKPLALMRWLLRLVTPVGGVVLEPFAGSGTTLIAAHLEHRTCRALELDPAYCDVIVQRWNQLDGTDPAVRTEGTP